MNNLKKCLKKKRKKVTIIVNGTPHEVEKDEITYEEVVMFAFPDYPQHPEINYSVKYKRGHGDKPEGILSPGGKVKVKNEMIFDVSATGQS
ncbi:MAG: multiubiquitin domain-containing protein [Saprospiraceae bacterium]|nr:multiubiquitin domain-containing protein [Saprospiraceae bacterium]